MRRPRGAGAGSGGMIADLDRLPAARYGAILADPAWRFATWADAGDDDPMSRSRQGLPRLFQVLMIALLVYRIWW